MSRPPIRDLAAELLRTLPDDAVVAGYEPGWCEWRERGAWTCGSQAEALRAFLGDRAEILIEATHGDYQGDHYALLRAGPTYVLWRDSFGSCSGCDGMDGTSMADAFEHVQATLREGNTRQFESPEAALAYLRDGPADYWWRDCPFADDLERWLISRSA